MDFSFSCRKNLLSRTAIVAPFFYFALAPSVAMAGNIVYNSGTMLNNISNAPGNVVIQPGSNIAINNPVAVNFNSNLIVALQINQNMSVSGPNATLTVSSTGSYGPVLEVAATPGSSNTLYITDGAKVNVVNGFAQAAWDQGSSGTITVSGQGSSLTAYGVVVGNNDTTSGTLPASGVLNIFDGAAVTSDVVYLATYGGQGQINISNATLTAKQTLYTNINGNGQININAGGVVVAPGIFSFGYPGSSSQAVVNLNQGGTLEVGGAGGLVDNEAKPSDYNFNLSGGTVKIINSNLTTSVNMNLVNGTNSIIDTNGYEGTFSGTLSGGGELIKVGAGTLVLTGSVTSAAPAAPGGDNAYGEVVIQDGEVQYGTPQIPVNYDQDNEGALIMSITPQTYPANQAPVQVYGMAILSKALVVNLAAPTTGGSYVMGTKYPVLVATGGVSGRFSNVDITGAYAPYLTGVPVYGPDGNADIVDVQLMASDSTIDTSRFYATAGYARNASLFDALSAPLGTGADYWLHGLGSFGHAPGVNYNYKGFAVGRGFAINPALVLGGAVSNVYPHTAGGNGSYTDGTTVGGEVYGIYTVPRWTITTTGAAGYLDNRSRRFLPGLGVGAVSNEGSYAGASLRVAYNWQNQSPILLTPYATVSYLHTHLGGGQEDGLGPFNTNYGELNTNLAQAGGGLTGSYKIIAGRSDVTTWVSVGGLGTLGNPNARVDETIGMQNASITGRVASSGMLTSGAGIELAGQPAPWKLALAWNGQFANRASGQAFTLQGSYMF